MTLAPEVVLLAELGLPCAAVALPHKRSVPPQHDSAQTLNAQMEQLRDASGPTAPRDGPYVYVHSRARQHAPRDGGHNEEEHNSSEASMRATLDGGQVALSRLVLAWLVRQAGWAPPGADPLRWYLRQMKEEGVLLHENNVARE